MTTKETDSKKSDNSVEKNKSQAMAEKVMLVLSGSADFNQAVKQFEGQEEKNKRIYSDLKNFRNEQIRLESSITTLKESFGEKNSLDDLQKLKGLKIDLEATLDAIALLEQKTGDARAIGRDLEDCRFEVKSCFDRALRDVKKEWQEEVNKLVDDFVTAIEEYYMAGAIVHSNHLKLYTSKIMRLAWFLNLRPRIEKFSRLERLTDDNLDMFSVRIEGKGNTPRPNHKNNSENISEIKDFSRLDRLPDNNLDVSSVGVAGKGKIPLPNHENNFENIFN